MGQCAAQTKKCANCPPEGQGHRPVIMAVLVQVATVGETQRRRGKSQTVYFCRACGRELDEQWCTRGRKVLTGAVMTQAAQLGLNRGR